MHYEIMDEEVLLEDFLNIKAYRLRHSLFEGGMSEPLRRLCLEKQKAVSVLLYDPAHQAVVMVEQFRIGAREMDNCWLLENPAGYVESGESAAQVAFREVREETGCEILQLRSICEFLVSPGISNERVELFCGRVDSSHAGGIHGLDEEHEDIRVSVLSLEQAAAELYGGRINSTCTLMTMQWLLLQLRDGHSPFTVND